MFAIWSIANRPWAYYVSVPCVCVGLHRGWILGYSYMWIQGSPFWRMINIHDHLISAIGSQKASRLCFLDISLLPLTPSRSFRVKCDNISSFHTSSCGVPQGSLLGPLLFVMYTTPLSTLPSFLSLDHPFTQMTPLFFTFHPLNTVIIVSKNNWSLHSLCFTLSLESTPSSVSSPPSFWYQFLYF